MKFLKGSDWWGWGCERGGRLGYFQWGAARKGGMYALYVARINGGGGGGGDYIWMGGKGKFGREEGWSIMGENELCVGSLSQVMGIWGFCGGEGVIAGGVKGCLSDGSVWILDICSIRVRIKGSVESRLMGWGVVIRELMLGKEHQVDEL